LAHTCTAALDARSEFEAFKRFKELSDGKRAVLISHRFSSVRMADRILVLADGMVEAAGTHDELMALHSLPESHCKNGQRPLTADVWVAFE
jgi:ABC-type multidrug transport system fused ATPase/permease subunit